MLTGLFSIIQIQPGVRHMVYYRSSFHDAKVIINYL